VVGYYLRDGRTVAVGLVYGKAMASEERRGAEEERGGDQPIPIREIPERVAPHWD
jgi:hypothetical protein